MAFVTTFNCKHCNQPRYEVIVSGYICVTCRTHLARIDELAHMEKLAISPLEERVRLLELVQYRERANERIKTLESKNATY